MQKIIRQMSMAGCIAIAGFAIHQMARRDFWLALTTLKPSGK
jgi:hypothetical protein